MGSGVGSWQAALEVPGEASWGGSLISNTPMGLENRCREAMEAREATIAAERQGRQQSRQGGKGGKNRGREAREARIAAGNSWLVRDLAFRDW